MSKRLREEAKVEHTIDGQVYSVKYGSLSINGYQFSKHPACEPDKIMDEIEPDRTEYGYWKAQYILRGLQPPRGGIREAMEGLKPHKDKPMTPENQQRESDILEKESANMKRLKGVLWSECQTDGQRADLDAERFIRELMPTMDDTEPLCLQLGLEGSSLREGAKANGIFYNSVEIQKLENDNIVGDEFIRILCKDEEKGKQKAKELRESAKNEIESAANRRKKTAKDKHANIVKEANNRTEWDVTGKWLIRCPRIESGWDMPNDLELQLFSTISGQQRQLFGKFDFNVVAGVWRFEKPSTLVPPPPEAGGVKRKAEDDIVPLPAKRRKAENVDFLEDFDDERTVDAVVALGDGDDEESGAEESDSEHSDTNSSHSSEGFTEGNYVLGLDDKPSRDNDRWAIRWIGHDQEQEVLLLDEKPTFVTFSNNGTEIEGELDIPFVGRSIVKFRGIKIEDLPEGESAPNIDAIWDDLQGQADAQLGDGYLYEDYGSDEDEDADEEDYDEDDEDDSEVDINENDHRAVGGAPHRNSTGVGPQDREN